MRGRPLAAFVVLAFLLSWAWWVPLAVRGDVVRQGDGTPTHLVGLLGPGVAAVVVSLAEGRGAELRDRMTRVPAPRWWLAVAAVLGLGGAAVLLAPPDDWRELFSYSGIGTTSPLVVVAVALVVNGIGEELGWRGFLVDRLAPRLGLLRTAAVVGVVWGVWHLPLFWVVASFRGLGVGGVLGWCLGLLAGSLVLARLYLGAGRSVLLVAVWHTAFNLTSGTAATGGLPAAVTSTAVMVVAAVLLGREVSNRRRRSRQVGTEGPAAQRHRAPS